MTVTPALVVASIAFAVACLALVVTIANMPTRPRRRRWSKSRR
jgi:hypothetical protein